MAFDAYIKDRVLPRASWLSKTSDLILAMVVVAIIALMILPLPLVVLDSLLAVNIALGVILVLMAIYVTSPLQFSVFPSVLLISTLFRLALSVATTRMILLNGDAGDIINTFGELVAGGNLVVGLVVFLIITLVQFLVIAKGAERVAEVGARFTLDAMPGKQMSIDSDLRSGLIDKVEARTKREEVELESKLHGSMDGAMKFVKGDAIAGIVIIIINLLGGLSIGVFQLGLDASVAMSRYSILTIGDGMVAQIPALFGAMSAGLIVTRVTSDESDLHLGDSIKKQFSSIPRVLLVSGGMCLLFAFIPGFPSIVFMGLGTLLLGLGGMLIPTMRAHMEKASQSTFQNILQTKIKAENTVTETTEPAAVVHAVPILLTLPGSLSATDGQAEKIRAQMSEVIDRYQAKSGVRIPKLKFHWATNPVEEWSLYVYEVPVATGHIESTDTVDKITIELYDALRTHGHLFMGIQEVSVMLTAASAEYPDVVKESLRGIPMQNMSTIFRNLVAEEIPIRNLRVILEALVNASQHEKDTNNLTEFARISLSREICHRHAPSGLMQAVALSPEVEEILINALRTSSGNGELAMDPLTVEKIRTELVKSITEHKPAAIVTPVQIRRHCRGLIVQYAKDIPVLSYSELEPTLDLQIIDRVEIDSVQKVRLAQA